MALHLIDAGRIAPQAWRNGGGQTRELLVWPAKGEWRLRISRADITADGPFSAFAGVTRWFAVLQGEGVALDLQGASHSLHCGDEALCFDGALAPACRLLGGPTQDLNLMVSGGKALMRRAEAASAWDEALRMRGLYTTVAGHWQSAQHSHALDAHTLLWLDDASPGPWHFTPGSGAGPAYWLGFTPAGDGKP